MCRGSEGKGSEYDIPACAGLFPYSPAYFLPRPNMGSLISGSCFNPLAMPFAKLLHSVCYSGACILGTFRDGVARILRDVCGLVSGILHSPGNGGTGILSALRYRIAGVLDGVRGLLPGVLQGLAGVSTALPAAWIQVFMVK